MTAAQLVEMVQENCQPDQEVVVAVREQQPNGEYALPEYNIAKSVSHGHGETIAILTLEQI